MSRTSVRRSGDRVNHRHGRSIPPDRARTLTEPGYFTDTDNGLT
jgi:hypothetical protein